MRLINSDRSSSPSRLSPVLVCAFASSRIFELRVSLSRLTFRIFDIFFFHLSGKTKGRSKKWRELLKFPHHTISAHLKNESKLCLAFSWSLLSLVFSLAVPLPTVYRICLNRFPVCRTYFLYVFNTQFSSLMTGLVYKSPLEGNYSDSFALAARDFSEPLIFSTKW